ncbi:MAG: M1 family peptidase, partial [Cloacibacterium sp.]
QTVTTQQIENYISEKSGINFSTVFDQYLRTTQIPILEYSQSGKTLKYRWTNTVEGFNLPIRIENTTLTPTKDWQIIKLKDKKDIKFNDNYYVNYERTGI